MFIAVGPAKEKRHGKRFGTHGDGVVRGGGPLAPGGPSRLYFLWRQTLRFSQRAIWPRRILLLRLRFLRLSRRAHRAICRGARRPERSAQPRSRCGNNVVLIDEQDRQRGTSTRSSTVDSMSSVVNPSTYASGCNINRW